VLSRDRVFEGERVAVTVAITTGGPAALVEIRGPLPAGCAVVSGRHRAVMALAAGGTARWTYEIGCPRRGTYELGTVVARVRDRFGLRTWEHTHVDSKPVGVYPKVAVLRTLPRPVHARASVGDYVSPALGEGIEPGNIRQFAPGDLIRQVNWRASLRLGKLY